MTCHALKMTTAIAVVLSLAAPAPVLAQAGEADPKLETGPSAPATAPVPRTRAEQEGLAEQPATPETAEAEQDDKPAKDRKKRKKADKDDARDKADKAEKRKKKRDKAKAQAKRAERVQAEAEGAAAARAGAEANPENVTTQTVTEADVRSSSQEFAGNQPAAAPRKGEDGLSDAGKVLLFGLGALAVNELLKGNDRVVANTGDRVVVEGEDGMRLIKDDDSLIRRPGDTVQTETFADGSSRTTVTRQNGDRIVTIRSKEGRVLRRSRILPDGREVVLFDDTQRVATVDVDQLPDTEGRRVDYSQEVSDADLARALAATGSGIDRRFTLAQIRNIDAVRKLVPEIEVDNITFATGSAAIERQEAQELATLGSVLRRAIESNPGEVFLIEGHTDAVGDAGYNLALSDRRAESVALALTEYFDVPPENLVVQGYGESDLEVPVLTAERENRRVAVRRITPLLN